MAPLTFVDTHNMIAFLINSDVSEGFDQIVAFLNAHMIQYALIVNPTIYVSCIKQFWTSVSIKKSNDVVRLQALIDRKKVIITEDTIRQALRLDDAVGVDCLPNEEIFVELARMGYEKPSTKLTFSKAFFSAQWKFLIYIILQCAIENAAEDEDDDNAVSAKPTPPSPTHVTPPPSPTQEHIPSPPQAQTAQPSSPPQQQPSQTANISHSAMTLLNILLETCATLTKQVANLEQDKISQAIKITKLKQRVRRRMYLNRGEIDELDVDEDVTLVDGEEDMNADDIDEAEPAEVEEVIEVVTTAKLMIEVVTTATTITIAQVPKASALRRKRGVVIQDPEETATTLVIMHFKVKEKQDNTVMRYQALKRKPITKAHARKNMMIYLKNMAGFKMDFFKGMTYNNIRPIFKKHYNSIRAFLEKGEKEIEEKGSKRKGNSLNQDAAKKQRIDEETEELKTHLLIVANNDDDVYTEATPLASKVPIVDYQIHHEHNKPYYKIIRADGTHQLFLSFITLLKNFDREDLEMLWKLV
nr:xylulose kinase-1 [Tanacetum cinerariifolium]